MKLNVKIIFLIFHLIIVTFFICEINGKIFERCELANLLRNKHNLEIEKIANWVCIAQHQSGFNSSLKTGALDNGAHGIFQISDQYWCSPPGKGWVCDVTCDKLRDDDLNDDIECAKIIYNEHQGLSGDGFDAWTAYEPFCKGKGYDIIQDCFNDINNIQLSTLSSSSSYHNGQHHKSTGKVYEKCELAHLLRNKHDLSFDEVANLVCIAQFQSNFNGSAQTGTLDNASHGLFQINDMYWCTSYSGRGRGCSMTCDRLRDDDLSDDIACVRTIHNEHQRISGDGYDAWPTYQQFCKGRAYDVIRDCFDENELTKPASPVRKTTEYFRQVKPVTFNNEIDTIDNSIYDTKNDRHYGKIYSPCELAQELYYKHKIPMDQIATWVCIAKHESNFNTSAIGRLNADGSEDHGLFQISDIYWCSTSGKGRVCGLSCSQLEDSDITDDVKCMKTIHAEHEILSGDGFTAWTVYKPHCQGQSDYYISGCFNEIEDNSILDEYTGSSSIRATTVRAPYSVLPKKKTGKIYSPCELAQELKEKYRMPEYQIATWVCIARYESNFNTSALGHGDHGIFQISQIYWCTPSGQGKACDISCTDLRDDDITDDVKCIKKIYEEHTRLSGDGFNAWTVYQQFCSRGRARKYIKSCESVIYEDSEEIYTPTITTTKKPYPTVPRPIYTQPPQISKTTTRKLTPTTSYYSSPVRQTIKPLSNNYGKTQSQINTSRQTTFFSTLTKSSTTKSPFSSFTQSFSSSSKKSGISSKKPWWEQQQIQRHPVRFGVLYDSSSSYSPNKFATSSHYSPFASATNIVTYTKILPTSTTTLNRSKKNVVLTSTIKPIAASTSSTTRKTTTKTTTIKPKSTQNISKSAALITAQTPTTKSAYRNAFDVYFNLFNIPSPYEKNSDGKRSANYANSPNNQRITVRTTTQRTPIIKNSQRFPSITTTTRRPQTPKQQIRYPYSSTTPRYSTPTTPTTKTRQSNARSISKTVVRPTTTVKSGVKTLEHGNKSYFFRIGNSYSSNNTRLTRSTQINSSNDPSTIYPLGKQIQPPQYNRNSKVKSETTTIKSDFRNLAR